MDRSRSTVSLAIVLCAVLLGCGKPTPLEQLEESRSLYKATLNSMFVRETPLFEESPASELADDGLVAAEDEAAAAAAEAGEGDPAAGLEDAVEPIPVPTRRDAVLDVIVQHDAYEPLNGLTLDITLVDDGRNEIGRWLRWVDTEGLPKANQRPYSIVLEDVAYEEGYGFHVEVRHPVPVAERGDYREYEGL